ncbi:cysteine-rich CWC family protein [Rudanella lutea]|uniref:cysteine-rich CWC family protein n=1 Tax=Rudanella lutea TaxID=451374 RepID=UPI0003A865AC|nr:cysteine-rich CWC family protein [Rudanella lutea]
MLPSEPTRCPRCHRPFACRAAAIRTCQCAAVPLTPAQREYIASRYKGCLCAECLQALAREVTP